MKKITVSLATLLYVLDNLGATTEYSLPTNEEESDKEFLEKEGVNAPDWENWADNEMIDVYSDLTFLVAPTEYRVAPTEYRITSTTWSEIAKSIKKEEFNIPA